MTLRIYGSTSGYVDIDVPAVAANDRLELSPAILSSKSDYAPSQNNQSGTGASAYTFVLADASRLTLANCASAATFTIPPQASVAWGSNSIIMVTSIGAGVVTIAGGAGVTVTNASTTLGQYQSAALIRTASNAWTLVPFSGTGKATYSASTGSPTVDTTTRPGKTIVTFNGSGTVTVGSEGMVEILVCGGAGGGASSANFNTGGGGGGAGGYVYFASGFLPAGSSTITIGSGGAGGSGAGGIGGSRGSNSNASFFAAPGGGGGGNANSTADPGASGGGATQSGAGGTGMPPLGRNGGAGAGSNTSSGGSGGGSSAVGNAGVGSGGPNAGGAGTANSINGTATTFSTGGAGGGNATAGAGAAGTANRAIGGGGGGGAANGNAGGAGGSGVVILVFG